MTRNDWIGVAGSLGLHAAAVAVMAGLSLAAAPIKPPERPALVEILTVEAPTPHEPPPPLAMEQKVKASVPTKVGGGKALKPKPAPRPTRAAPQKTKRAAPPATPPSRPKAVNAPKAKAAPSAERVATPPAERVAPDEKPSVNQEVSPRADRAAEAGAARPGSGAADRADRDEGGMGEGGGGGVGGGAPFSIQGLNRSASRIVLPENAVGATATIVLLIEVDPAGNVVGAQPRRKANPRLEAAAVAAVRQWQFAPLPPNAPRANQRGSITFRFRAE